MCYKNPEDSIMIPYEKYSVGNSTMGADRIPANSFKVEILAAIVNS